MMIHTMAFVHQVLIAGANTGLPKVKENYCYTINTIWDPTLLLPCYLSSRGVQTHSSLNSARAQKLKMLLRAYTLLSGPFCQKKNMLLLVVIETAVIEAIAGKTAEICMPMHNFAHLLAFSLETICSIE